MDLPQTESKLLKGNEPSFALTPAFVMDLFSPAVALPRLREIVSEKKWGLLWTWLILPALVVAWSRPSPGLAPDDFGAFLLFVVIPSLSAAYWVVWVQPLLGHLRQQMGLLLRARLLNVLIVPLILLIPLSLMTAMVVFLTSDVPLFQGFAVYLFLPLGAFIVVAAAALLPHGNGPSLAASFGPMLGVQGLGQMMVGRHRSGILRVFLGWLIVASAAWLLRISWMDTYRWNEPHQLINLGLYVLGVAYFGIWLVGMAESAPQVEEVGADGRRSIASP